MDDIFSFENLYADEGVPDELYRLVRDGLDTELENRLKELPNCQEHLQAVRWYGQEQFSLLMLAAYYGYDHIVRLLLDIDPSTEHVQLYGKFYIEEQEERLAGATALFCACYRGHFQVAKTLIDIGHADVDDVTLDRSDLPLLLQATIHNRLDIIRFLIENGYADVNKTKSLDRRKYNALFYAVENNCTSVIEYLLDHGVDINYKISVHDMQTRALGRAIELNHVESFNLLCQRGAHLVYQNQSDDDGDDDIKSTILNSTAYPIIQFFLEEKFIDVKDLELEACDVIARSSNMESNERIVDLLRFALQYRRRTGLTKSSAPLQSFYKFHQECQTIDELDSLINNRERTLIEGILILERLCPSRKEKLFTLIEEYGTLLCSQKDYETCLDLWLHLAEIDQQFNGDYGTHLFVWYFCQLLNDKRTISVSRFLQAVYFIIKKENVGYGEKDLNNALFLVIIATKVSEGSKILSITDLELLCLLDSPTTNDHIRRENCDLPMDPTDLSTETFAIPRKNDASLVCR